MLQVKKVTADLLEKCRNFLTRDLIANVLVLGDCYSPLLEASSLYCTCEGDQVLGVCSVFKAFPNPSIALGEAPVNVRRILLQKAMEEVQAEFMSIIPVAEVSLFEEYASILKLHREQQMVADSFRHGKCKHRAVRVQENELAELDAFYLQHHSEAWARLQFKVGPFYCIKRDERIVSVAGVHLCTPQIAHLGSILTDEAYQNMGFSTACTFALSADLSTKGRILSLYVKTDNKIAIRMYEKLGFMKKREVALITMRKNTLD